REIAWHHPAKKNIEFNDQSKEIKYIKSEITEYASVSSQSMSITLQRVERAYGAFFRRVASGMGKQSGHPRLVELRKYSGWGYRTAIKFRNGKRGKISIGNGWRWEWKNGTRRATVHLCDCGTMKAWRASDIRNPGQVRDITIRRIGDDWFV